MEKYFRLFIFILALVIPQRGFSWGNEGHSIVALVAKKILINDKSDEAKNTLKAINTILGDTPIDSAATWADVVKKTQYKYTASWHFVNTDASKYAYDPSSPIYSKGDLVVIIRLLSHLLRGDDDSTLKTVGTFTQWNTQCMQKPDHPCKKEALEFLIHLVGDIHQPLHSGSLCDVGGNSQYIYFFGKQEDPAAFWCKPQDPPACKNHELHQAWDASLLLLKYVSNEDYSTQLIQNMGKLTSSSDAAHCVTADPSKSINIDDSDFPAGWVDESLCYMPQIYTFPDDLSAKQGGKGRSVAQVSNFKVPNRCRADRAMVTTSGTRQETNYSQFQVGPNYYDTNITTINERLYWGGSRLATLLKTIYGNGDKSDKFK